jgi:hypothetical protein
MSSRLRTLSGLLLMGSATLFAGGPCKTDPVSVAINPIYTYGGTSASSMIYPDTSAAYTDGVSGVSAIINTSCTADLILDLGSSTRTIGFSFQNAVVTNSSTPSWTATPFMATADHLVVRNLLYQYSSGAYYQFTTSAVLDFTAPGGALDRVTFANPNAQVPAAEPNQPYNTALVVVTHTPADPGTGAVESWTITPSNANTNPAGTPVATELGTLLLDGKHGYTNAGQFSMPFQFTVSRK